MTTFTETGLAVGAAIGAALPWLSPLLAGPLLVAASPRTLGPAARAVADGIDRVNGMALWFAGGLALLMALAQVATVGLRYGFAESAGWLEETVTYAFGGMIFLGCAGALRGDAHVRVDILSGRFGKRGQALVDLIGTYVFLFPVMILLVVVYGPSLAVSWRVAEGSLLSDGIPFRYGLNTLVSAFGLAMIAQGWAQAVRAALRWRGEEDGRPTADAVAL
jgi:TRAP-type mannitol/chloroaromatic compound transport system permease small subunit